MGAAEQEILLHPPLVHFPIAFFFLEFVLLLYWVMRKDDVYKRFALFVFRLAFVFMIAAIPAGFVDAGGFEGIQGPVKRHAIAGAVLFIANLFRAFYWKKSGSTGRSKIILCAGALLSVAISFFAGYLGGVIVYES